MLESPKELRAEAQRHGLHLRSESVKWNESGMDFLAAFATDEAGVAWVLRTPRRPDVVEAAEREGRILGLVRPHLPVVVPEWHIHTPKLIAYPRLAGEPVATIDPTIPAYVWRIEKAALPASFIESLGAAVAALHSISANEAAAAGIKVTPPDQVRTGLAAQVARVKARWEVAEPLSQRWRAWLEEDSYWPDHSALIHGDLHAGHILTDDQGTVTGLLDWTTAEVTDPARDLALHYSIFGGPALDSLLAAYAAHGGRTWPRMREHVVEWWAAYPLFVAEFALVTGTEEIAAYAQRALREEAETYLQDVGPTGIG